MKVLELFSGYGSQALALENLGIDFISDISEIDKYAIHAYNQLHGETHNWGDITQIDEKQLPYYDLITYSSPCQDFSTAGLQMGGDEGSGTRSSLLWECERIIRAVKPKYLLMENVKNLVGKKHKHNFIRWLNILEGMGYWNFWKVLNAKDYGVPQNRERVFVVSILGGRQYLFPNPVKLEKLLKDVLENNVNEKYYLCDEKIEQFIQGINNSIIVPTACASRGRNPDNPSDRTKGCPTEQRLEINNTGVQTLTTAEKDNYIIEPKIIKEGFNLYPNSGNPQAGRVYNIEGISPTMDTCSGGNRMPKIIQNYRVRKLTPRECWRLMGVKDEQFNKLKGISNTQLYKLAGNSIVVDVLMAIFKNLFISDEESTGQLTLF